MKASRVINCLKDGNQDDLLASAELELMEDMARQYCEITRAIREKALKKYLADVRKNLYATCGNNGRRCITNGYSAILLTDRNDLTTFGDGLRSPPTAIEDFMRTEPGEQVNVVWLVLYIELELHRDRYHNKPLYARVGDVVVIAQELADTRLVLGGSNLAIYQAGSDKVLQLESENGKAVIMQVPREVYAAGPMIDVTAVAEICKGGDKDE